MQLSDERWTAVPMQAPFLAFLKGEWDKSGNISRWVDPRLVTHADLNSDFENRLRMGLLLAVHGGLLQQLPQDTQWFEVRLLRRKHLAQLRVIARCGWDDPGDKNEVPKVASRRPLAILKDAASWEPLLLWGHDRNGPFTILERNNRLVAFAGADPGLALDLPCYIGLSKKPCAWHLADSSFAP